MKLFLYFFVLLMNFVVININVLRFFNAIFRSGLLFKVSDLLSIVKRNLSVLFVYVP